MKTFPISSRLLSSIFWRKVLEESDALQHAYPNLSAAFYELEKLRTKASYDTGSVSLRTMCALYSLVNFFRPRTIVEVGTFVGRSTIAMSIGSDDDCTIYTCDGSNDIDLPKIGFAEVIQFKKRSSTDMFRALNRPIDLLFLDGRVLPDDIELLQKLINSETMIALDDYDGVEKGVANAFTLRSTIPLLKNHIFIEPPVGDLRGIVPVGYCPLGLLMPLNRFTFTTQG